MSEDTMGGRNRIAAAVVVFALIAGFVITFDWSVFDDDAIYYCSNDGEDYAKMMGGISCPEGPGVVPMCPNDEPCVCIDGDDSCDDGDDDWGYYPKEDNQEESTITLLLRRIVAATFTRWISSCAGSIGWAFAF
jgi:hypothetical protein